MTLKTGWAYSKSLPSEAPEETYETHLRVSNVPLDFFVLGTDLQV